MDLNSGQRIQGLEAQYTVDVLPSDRLRFGFDVSNLQPSRYHIQIAFQFHDTHSTPKVAEAEFNVYPEPGWTPENPSIPDQAIALNSKQQSKGEQPSESPLPNSDSEPIALDPRTSREDTPNSSQNTINPTLSASNHQTNQAQTHRETKHSNLAMEIFLNPKPVSQKEEHGASEHDPVLLEVNQPHRNTQRNVPIYSNTPVLPLQKTEPQIIPPYKENKGPRPLKVKTVNPLDSNPGRTSKSKRANPEDKTQTVPSKVSSQKTQTSIHPQASDEETKDQLSWRAVSGFSEEDMGPSPKADVYNEKKSPTTKERQSLKPKLKPHRSKDVPLFEMTDSLQGEITSNPQQQNTPEKRLVTQEFSSEIIESSEDLFDQHDSSSEKPSESQYSEDFDQLSELEYEGPDRFDTSWHKPINPHLEHSSESSSENLNDEWSEEWTEELSMEAPSLFQIFIKTILNPTQDKFYSIVIYGIVIIIILIILLLVI